MALKSDFTKTMAELEPLLKIREGRADQLRRTAITSPTRGIVKDIRVSTIGGVVGSGGAPMEIARVQRISPDTIEDQVDRRIYYYRVYVLTEHAYLETKEGKRHPIMPGMVATAEIRTGQRTVLQYLLKPLNRAAEAMRER